MVWQERALRFWANRLPGIATDLIAKAALRKPSGFNPNPPQFRHELGEAPARSRRATALRNVEKIEEVLGRDTLNLVVTHLAANAFEAEHPRGSARALARICASFSMNDNCGVSAVAEDGPGRPCWSFSRNDGVLSSDIICLLTFDVTHPPRWAKRRHLVGAQDCPEHPPSEAAHASRLTARSARRQVP